MAWRVALLTVAVSLLAGALAVSDAAAVNRTTTLLSKPTGVVDPNTAPSSFDEISLDGTRVFFHSMQKLTADDTDSGRFDVYERFGGRTTLVSKPTGVADPDTDDVFENAISADGDRVFIVTTQKMTADDLDSGRQDV